jgi:hypothetical protein
VTTSPPPIASDPPPPRSPVWSRYYGVKYNENDATRIKDLKYKSKNISNGLERCIDECSKTAGCNALTVHDPNKGKSLCVLYRGTPSIAAVNQDRFWSTSFA